MPRQFCGRTRREFLWEMGGGFAGTALAGLLANDGFFARTAAAAEPNRSSLNPRNGNHPGKAKNVIFLMMNGGPSQVDTFDHKPALEKHAGQALRWLGLRTGRRSLFLAQFALGIYGGYFGGAVGLMMLAVWTLFTSVELRSMTPLRVLMVAAANGVAVICFAISGSIRWPETLIVMAGAICGGYLGAHAGRRLPAPVARALILAITIATTAGFFLRANA